MSIETKEMLLEVLLYLYENYMDNGITPKIETKQLIDELELAGFEREEITGALRILDNLVQMANNENDSCKTPSIRMYSFMENQKLSVISRGFLIFLERTKILDTITRERVIERAMALDVDEVDIQQLKWVILMVLFNQATPEINLLALINVSSVETTGRVH